MANDISTRAEISPKAVIGNNCKIYPFVYIEDDVVIGDNCVIYPFVSIMRGTRMGNNNKVFQGSVLGALPQDFDFCGDKSELIIGNGNVIRENVVINRATHKGGQTVLGDENFIMEGAHVSHDTKIGNRCVLGYGTKIAGDCVIGNSVIYSTNVIQKGRTRVGDFAALQAGTSFSRDVPPFVVAGGYPIAYLGINKVMLTAAGVTEKNQKHIANAYRLVFHGQNDVFDAVNQIKQQVPDGVEIRMVTDFISATQKGIITKL